MSGIGGWPMGSGNSLGGPDPMVGDPGNPLMDQRVQKLVAHTPEEPLEYMSEPRYYICTMPNASMFRKDGTRLIFAGGVFETNIVATARYLEMEIGLQNPFLRVATVDEINEYKMRKDPRGHIKEQVRGEIELELRVKLEAEIMERLGMLSATYIPGQDGVDSSNIDGAKVAGSDISDHLAAAKRVLKTDNATITMMDAPAPTLKGIVNSNNVADIADGAPNKPAPASSTSTKTKSGL